MKSIKLDLESLAVNYADVNSSKPVLRLHRPKKRFKPRIKRPKPNTPIKILRRKLSNIRSKIVKRLDDTTFRLGNKSNLPKKRMEANRYYREYKLLRQRLEKLEQMKKHPQKLM